MENILLVNRLYENELYSSVIQLSSLLYTCYENDRLSPNTVFGSSPEIEYQLLLFQANAHYYEHNYRLSIGYFTQAITLRKTLIKGRNLQFAAIENSCDNFSDTETKYRLAICYRELRESKNAISTLQTIANKSRSPKVNMLLAKLLHHSLTSSSNEAVPVYKDVIRECPLALDAIKSLLEIGVDGIEVNSMIMNVSIISKNSEWLNSWIKGHAQIYSRKHLEASKTFKWINENTKFHQNPHILSLIGHSLYYNGNYDQALPYFETVHMINPHMTEPLMPMAVIYAKKNRIAELEKLASIPAILKEFTSEHWFVLAQSLCANGKIEKASYFTHKSISMDPRNVESFLLRGKIFHDLKRYTDSIPYFRNAQNLASYRFEIYKGLFSCYVGMKRVKEAQTMAQLAAKYFRNSTRSYVLLARTLMVSNNQTSKKQAKAFLKRALEIDEYYLPAVTAMADLFKADGETSKAVSLLKKQVASHPNCKVFTMLGDTLSADEKELDAALEYYTTALSMDPTNQKALDGVNSLGQTTRANKHDECSLAATSPQDEEWPIDYDDPSIEAVEFTASAPVGTVDGESESETIWSDVDAELNT